MNPIRPIRVLLIEDDEDDYLLARSHLSEIEHTTFDLEWAPSYAQGLDALVENRHDICLVDYCLGQHSGVDLLRATGGDFERMPIIVLTGQSDRVVDMEAMEAGAADYLEKSAVNSNLLERAIRYALAHNRLRRELRALSLFDELTGLHNRRGFLTLAEHEFKVAQRIKHEIVVFFVDLDGMKQINDNYGHAAGDEALIRTAELLRKTFRDSDILARLGGDEFAIVTSGARLDCPDAIIERLQTYIEADNVSGSYAYRLAMSVGAMRYDPSVCGSLQDLLAEADKMMYEKKQAKKRHQAVG